MDSQRAPIKNVRLPDVWSVREKRAGNALRQLAWRGLEVEGTVCATTIGQVRGFLIRAVDGTSAILVVKGKPKVLPEEFDSVLSGDLNADAENLDLRRMRWLRHPALKPSLGSPEIQVPLILASWQGATLFVGENAGAGVVALRAPQQGALHAIMAHWSCSNTPATVVLPTGTGKTDTMIAALVALRCARLLVLVPSDTLREQLSQKFLELGVLSHPSSPILPPGAVTPIVATLEHIPKTRQEVESLFGAANVVVTTSNIPAASSDAVQAAMAELCPYLFIDEAHHAEAPTWRAFKNVFRNNRILQFTATPFREDGQPLDGKIIYNYTLRRAQQEGYFQPIVFAPVTDYNPATADLTIAKRVIDALAENPKHIAMARVGDVRSAQRVYQIYKNFPEINAVQLHTGITSVAERRRIREEIVSGRARVVVCVDMLGEGFDLPELKVAAFHDIRKTLAVTLQLAGRFIRARSDLGHATFIANTATVDVQDELRNLYVRDPDWNVLLPQLIESAIGQQQSLQDFIAGFTQFPPEFPIAAVQPALSTVVYRTQGADWDPGRFRSGIPNAAACAQILHSLNIQARTLLVVTAQEKSLSWMKGDSVHDWQWELFVIYWWQEKALLFINGSANSGNYLQLAEALCGEQIELIKGQTVFRSFHGITRLQLQNVGLSEQLGRNVRYTARMGASVGTALTDVQKRKSSKSVLSGAGYSDGYRAGIGASRKGRIWTHRRDNLDVFTGWCRAIGVKLLDDSIDEDQILGGTLVPVEITSRPTKFPINADWPENIYQESEGHWSLRWDGVRRELCDVSLTLSSPSAEGPLKFFLGDEIGQLECEIQILNTQSGFRIVCFDPAATIETGRRGASALLSDFFYEHPPKVWFADGSSLEGNELIELKTRIPPYDSGKLVVLDWSGTDIRKESQGESRRPDSIQWRIIHVALAGDAEIVFDDDGSGEAADVVTVRIVGNDDNPSEIEVFFYHCKYSQDAAPGARIDDLYVVCGQAQKSIAWMWSTAKSTDLFTHLLKRDATALERGRRSRFEKGDAARVAVIREMSRKVPVSLKICIVQPGVSKASASASQLELLAVTENHLWETFQLSFQAIVSA